MHHRLEPSLGPARYPLATFFLSNTISGLLAIGLYVVGRIRIRNSNVQKTDCKARVKFRLTDEKDCYFLYEFEDRHNHELVSSEYKHLLRERRKLDDMEEKFIHRVASNNIGATRAHNVLSSIRGSRYLVHGTITDFKNCRRDLNVFIGENDAQMLKDKMEGRRDHLHNFSFEYKLENSELSAFFWADETAKCNYEAFGDIISFDATYRTNRYCMVFVPFTGVDNHRKCVTIGAGMIAKENIESFTFLLESFLKAFKKQPNIIVTDQDPAMKVAASKVFTESKHRLCTWHITNKLPTKVCGDVENNAEFKSKFHKLVWSIYTGPEQFEKRWRELMEEYNLLGNKWLSDMYEIRHRWIPSYFKDVEFCGLMRTTSRSESENSFFNSFTHYGDTLIQFMFSFDAAMDKQRYIQETLDHQTKNTTPKYKTPLNIEKHAAKLYTRTIFRLIQVEIEESVWRCSHNVVNTEGVIETTIVKEKRKSQPVEDDLVPLQMYNTEPIHEFKVTRNTEDGNIECSCQMFLRLGILCKHIFHVLNKCDIEEIPEKYICKRWMKDLIPADIRQKKVLYSETDNEAEEMANKAISSVDYCLRALMNNKAELKEFVEKIENMRAEIEDKGLNQEKLPKEARYESMLGVRVREQNEIQNPTGIRNKGSGTGKRLKGPGEKAIEKKKRTIRKCNLCGIYTDTHDSRNCRKYHEELERQAEENKNKEKVN
ncbi:protein FAR1-RELATED SEQUENCE 5-like [Helianthus annuus]|uniref:protein FAR1-RELATED SEQUENCE 5-like n=1 Tax=Helianthus annuus TaxID=4232 RepID=UPI000B905663|nr:protein FAR1-RELATED SEQUENCE 5-like [Helianthus annuus]